MIFIPQAERKNKSWWTLPRPLCEPTVTEPAADCSAMASRPPQGNAIITAEMPPDIGESGTSRYFTLELQEIGATDFI